MLINRLGRAKCLDDHLLDFHLDGIWVGVDRRQVLLVWVILIKGSGYIIEPYQTPLVSNSIVLGIFVEDKIFIVLVDSIVGEVNAALLAIFRSWRFVLLGTDSH